LGAPFEWRRQVNQVSFYTQDLQGEPLPNDDLDIQLLWLIALEEKGLDLDAHTWLNTGRCMSPPIGRIWNSQDQYAGRTDAALSVRCTMNIKTAVVHLSLRDMGLYRPRKPDMAARFAYQDAILDHGNGEGVYGEIFCAALESAAFVVNDLPALIEIGLSYIPEKCGVTRAIQDAVNSFRAGRSWLEARDRILQNFRGLTFMNLPHHTSQKTGRKVRDGQRGWDAPRTLEC